MRIRELIRIISSDAYRYTGSNSILKSTILYFTVIGFRYSFWMRVCSYLRKSRWLLPLRALTEVRLSFVSHRSMIQIPSSTKIGSGCYIGHYGTIVINGNTIIGKNVNISPDVNIGRSNRGDKKGTAVIGNNVYIAPGVRIVDAVHIGNNVAIGANAVVTKDIPDNAVVVGVPARIISYDGSEGYINRTINS